MICVFPSDATDFASNGLCVLTPTACSVTETLNGEWELSMTHPLDERDKWTYLRVGCIIRAPVPAAMTPRVSLVTQTIGWSVYTITTKSGKLNLRSGPGTNYKRLGQYAKGKEVVLIAKTNDSWYEVTAPDGKRGYMSTDYLTFARTEGSSTTATGQVVEPRQVRDQPFRIYRVVPTLTQVEVYARHIFYDLMDNMILSYKPEGPVGGTTAALAVLDRCESAHDFTMYTDLTGTAEGLAFEHINPVEAMLGDEGIVGKYHAELARDWYDVYLVKRVGHDTDVEIRQGKNLLGISYDVDESGVVTRIVPTGEDKDGHVLYLPEKHIDSPNIGAYPHAKWGHLAVSDAKEDDETSKSDVYRKLREAAQTELDNGCDLPTLTLDVNFLSVDDTEEYRDFGILHSIYLGDAVRVVVPRLGLTVALRMTQYTYDCLLRKYTSCTLGTALDGVEGSMISASQLAAGSIGGIKLAMGSIGTGHLQDGSVGSLQVRTAAIGSAHIQQAAIGEAHIQNAAITTAKIEDLAVTRGKIAEAAIGAAQIEDASITRAKIGEAAIGSAQIEEGIITSAHIGAGEIQEANIHDGAITHAKITDGAIRNAHIENGAIDSAKIADAAIQNAHIAGAAIDTANIRDGAIANAKIADAAVTRAKIADLAVGSAQIDDLAVTTAKIAQAAITNAQIANAAIDTAKIALGAITAALIEQGAVGTAQIADGSITDAKIVELTANKITAGVLSVERLIIRGSEQSIIYAINNMGELVSTQVDTIDGYVLTERTITADKIVAHSITAAEIAAKTITANEILSGTITGNEIAGETITGANIKAGTLTTSHVTADFGETLDLSSNAGINQRVQKVYEDMNALARNQAELIVGTQTAATAAWTGVSALSALKDGTQITYWLPQTSSSSATLDLTLKDGSTTGAIPLYYSGLTRLSTQYSMGNVLHLTYRENVTIGSTTIAKGWWADANYDSNTYDRIRMSNSVLAKSAITTSRIIVSDESGYFHLVASKPFLISKPILWAASSFSAGYYGSNNYLSYPNCSLRNNLPGFTGTTQKTCYIVGRLDGEMFTPTSTLFTTDVPDEVDGLVYIALGIMVSAYGIYLYPEHPMFSFVGDSFKNLNQVAFEAPAELETKLAEVHAQISTTADSIRQEVQATYAPATDMAAIRQQMTTLSEQTEANFTWTVSQYGTLASEVQDAKEATEEQMRLIQTYMTFGENGLVIGKSGNPFTFRVVNDRLAFYMNNTEVAYLSNNKLYVTQAEILTRLQVGKFAFEPQTNDNLSLIYTG